VKLGKDVIKRFAFEGERADSVFGYVLIELENGTWYAQKDYNCDMFFDLIRKAMEIPEEELDNYFIGHKLKRMR